MLPLVSHQRLCQALRLSGDPNDGHSAGGQHIRVAAPLRLQSPAALLWHTQSKGRESILNVLPLDLEADFDGYLEFVHSAVDDATAFLNDLKPIHVTDGF